MGGLTSYSTPPNLGGICKTPKTDSEEEKSRRMARQISSRAARANAGSKNPRCNLPTWPGSFWARGGDPFPCLFVFVASIDTTHTHPNLMVNENLVGRGTWPLSITMLILRPILRLTVKTWRIVDLKTAQTTNKLRFATPARGARADNGPQSQNVTSGDSHLREFGPVRPPGASRDGTRANEGRVWLRRVRMSGGGDASCRG